MKKQISRRELLSRAAAFTGLATLGLPLSAIPALAQGEEVISFTDVPERFNPGARSDSGTRYIDTREIDNFITPKDDFYIVSHYPQPEINPETFRLKISGLVGKPREYSMDDLRALPRIERTVGFECGGNQKALLHGLAGNAWWGGVRLASLMDNWDVRPEGTEVVFFGADKGEEEIRRAQVEMQFARSLPLEEARRYDVMVAFEMNGEPLPAVHGAPLRLIVPGAYGIANVKWLSHIHIQDRRWMGRFMGKDYVTLRHRDVGGEMMWTQDAVSGCLLKSVIARVTRRGNRCKITGFALNDGTPMESVEIKIDDGPWQTATIDPRSTDYSWKLFTYDWDSPTKGEHTLVSRATDIKGNVQPRQEDVAKKITYWENPGQWPRTVEIS